MIKFLFTRYSRFISNIAFMLLGASLCIHSLWLSLIFLVIGLILDAVIACMNRSYLQSFK